MVISPGPGKPQEYEEMTSVIWSLEPPVPTLGICMGYQTLCLYMGANIERLPAQPCHGHVSRVKTTGSGLFQDIAEMDAMRYHSLVATDIPSGKLQVCAWLDEDEKTAMAVSATCKPFYGVLFHPESVFSSHGEQLIQNFYELADLHNAERIKQSIAPTWAEIDVRPKPLYTHPASEERNISAVRTTAIELSSKADIDIIKTYLCHKKKDYVLLESAKANERWSIIGLYGGPQSQILRYFKDTCTLEVTTPSLWKSTRTLNQDFWSYCAEYMGKLDYYIGVNQIPFWGGFIGAIGYAMGSSAMGEYSSSKDPSAAVLFADRSIVFDQVDNVVYIQSLNQNDEAWLDEMKFNLANAVEKAKTISTSGHVDYTCKVDYPDRAAYVEHFNRVQEHLQAGDSYEICLTTLTSVQLDPDNIEDKYILFRRLREHNPAPFASLVNLKDVCVISASPERFMSCSEDHCSFQPMKGTLAKQKHTFEEASRILQNPKDLAELRIICDLIRNDLHQVANPISSVKVTVPVKVEEFKTVFQLISKVEGDIVPPFGGWDALLHSLPPGSMTGAPKPRTLEIINALEAEPRGLYSGVVGYWGVNNTHDWSVVIRSAISLPSYPVGMWKVGAGGAITVLSNVDDEWAEMVTKLESVLPAFIPQKKLYNPTHPYQLLETTVYDSKLQGTKRYYLFDSHVERMRTASLLHGFVFPGREYIENELDKITRPFDGKGRLRWTMDRVGNIEGTVSELKIDSSVQWIVYIDEKPTETHTKFVTCKTTERKLYNVSRERLRILENEDVLLWNENGFVTESSVCNVAFYRNGRWTTPRLSHGLLNGVMRRELLEKKFIFEGDISVGSIQHMEKIMLFNSLRHVFTGTVRVSRDAANSVKVEPEDFESIAKGQSGSQPEVNSADMSEETAANSSPELEAVSPRHNESLTDSQVEDKAVPESATTPLEQRTDDSQDNSKDSQFPNELSSTSPTMKASAENDLTGVSSMRSNDDIVDETQNDAEFAKSSQPEENSSVCEKSSAREKTSETAHVGESLEPANTQEPKIPSSSLYAETEREEDEKVSIASEGESTNRVPGSPAGSGQIMHEAPENTTQSGTVIPVSRDEVLNNYEHAREQLDTSGSG